ncbi:2-dehydro-3-deoxy-6-phosphogalactonate aldolase [Thalassotalea nanhaiensis]|uniref:2-dehydro-3-deoxy-6-phosphogalactonate aldolase n=1 Tax=Thalassotalea nanhaiensis TaxID=3065648 RepID=A0ABY9TN35_9GAMM|nr:2-dehydro-3-deoxy-6-phosphogalactonate aldolase [Colwelliaceae bacterium SQ345]
MNIDLPKGNMLRQLQSNPCIAILRGLKPAQAKAIGQKLYQHGIKIMEVPLNREGAYESIEILYNSMPSDCLIGAGTVTKVEQLDRLHALGIKLAISPNTDVDIIQKAAEYNMLHMPGVATPSEVYTAYNSGARWLKLFPATTFGTGHLKALLSIAPKGANFIAVGGLDTTNLKDWMAAGAKGVGIGNSLYSEDDIFVESEKKIALFAEACKQIK